MLAGNPLLAFLGRRGRANVAEALVRNPTRTWSVRDLARFADVDPMAASRAVRELAALGAVEFLRPGRDARIRFLDASAAGAFLKRLRVPDLREQAARAFAASLPRGLLATVWIHPDEDPANPLAPTRIALIARDPAQALDRAGPALEGVRASGYATPDVSAWTPEMLQDTEDPVARAIAAGRRL